MGLVAQAGFMAREIDHGLSAAHRQPLRRFLVRADALLPAGAQYAATSPVRSDDARYYLYPRQPVTTGFSRSALRRSGVRYVVVTWDAVPPDLRGAHDWYTPILTATAGRLLEVHP